MKNLSTVLKIQHLVADTFCLSSEDLRLPSRERMIAIPRQIGMYLAKQLTEATLAEIGLDFGCHGTTVMHSVAKIHTQRKSDAELNRVITRLLQELSA